MWKILETFREKNEATSSNTVAVKHFWSLTDTSRNYYIDIHTTFLNQLNVLFRWYMHQPKKTTLSDTWMSVRTSTSSTFGDTIKGSSHYAWIPPMTPSSQAHLTKVFVSGISGNYTYAFKLEKILKGSLDLIPSVKIQIMFGKVCFSCKGKTLLGIVNKSLRTKILLTSPSNVFPPYHK